MDPDPGVDVFYIMAQCSDDELAAVIEQTSNKVPLFVPPHVSSSEYTPACTCGEKKRNPDVCYKEPFLVRSPLPLDQHHVNTALKTFAGTNLGPSADVFRLFIYLVIY